MLSDNFLPTQLLCSVDNIVPQLPQKYSEFIDKLQSLQIGILNTQIYSTFGYYLRQVSCTFCKTHTHHTVATLTYVVKIHFQSKFKAYKKYEETENAQRDRTTLHLCI